MQEKSRQAKEAKSKNKYDHFLGKGGYRALKKKLDSLPGYYLVNGDTKEKVDLTGMTGRVVLWLMARAKQDKKEKERFEVKGLVVEVMTQELEWLEKKNRGEWVPDHRLDELSQVLGPEHPGRLRGYPMYANQSNVYDDPRSRKATHSECVPKAEVRFLITLSFEFGQTTLKYIQL